MTGIEITDEDRAEYRASLAAARAQHEADQRAYDALPEVISETLDALERRYAPVPEPTECRVCGAAMDIAAIGGGSVTWVCVTAAQLVMQPYSRENSDHYARSKVQRTSSGDAMVLALVAAYRRFIEEA